MFLKYFFILVTSIIWFLFKCSDKIILEDINLVTQSVHFILQNGILCNKSITLGFEGGDLCLQSNKATVSQIEYFPHFHTERFTCVLQCVNARGVLIRIFGVNNSVERVNGNSAFLRPFFIR